MQIWMYTKFKYHDAEIYFWRPTVCVIAPLAQVYEKFMGMSPLRWIYGLP